MRALVSGSTGFSGGFLVAALRARGVEVHAVSQRSEAPGVTRLDLTSSDAWAGALRELRPDHVFHVSGVVNAELAELARHNTVAAAALCDAALAAEIKPQSVLCVGSAAEYGLVPEAALPVSEDFDASPRSPYGATKLAQTRLALDAARRGLRVIVARPSNIIGPGMPLATALGSFARQLRQIELGRAQPRLDVGDLTTRRDFVDVRDVAQAYLGLALDSTFSGLVNVAAGEHVSMRSVLDLLIAEFGLAVQVEVDPARLRPVEVQSFSASPARLQAALGQRPTTPLSQTLRDIVAHERRTLTQTL